MCCDTKRCGGECHRRRSVKTTFVENKYERVIVLERRLRFYSMKCVYCSCFWRTLSIHGSTQYQ